VGWDVKWAPKKRKRRLPEAFCPFSGKSVFESRKAAKNAAYRRGKKHELRAYQCDGCGKFHLSKRKWGERPELIAMVQKQSAEHRVLRIILELAKERES
jgi:hypothetical protein